jgi:hypothetical protein
VGKVIALILTLLTLFYMVALGWLLANNTSHWRCNAEDEVVVIGNKCIHIDEVIQR